MIRRKRSRGGRQKPFVAINITPFTDVLLVLLIIFLIAGSSMTREGLALQKVTESGAGTGSPSEEAQEGTLWLDSSGSMTYVLGAKILKPVRLNEIDRGLPLNLTAHPSVSMGKVTRLYDELLGFGFVEVRFTAPQDSAFEL